MWVCTHIYAHIHTQKEKKVSYEHCNVAQWLCVSAVRDEALGLKQGPEINIFKWSELNSEYCYGWEQREAPSNRYQ